jgi:tRNA (guanine-N1)-methyltransferase
VYSRYTGIAMRIDVLTLFPEMFEGPLTESILKRGIEAGKLDIRLHDIRKFATNKHRQVDDKPYGGECGRCKHGRHITRINPGNAYRRHVRVSRDGGERGH